MASSRFSDTASGHGDSTRCPKGVPAWRCARLPSVTRWPAQPGGRKRGRRKSEAPGAVVVAWGKVTAAQAPVNEIVRSDRTCAWSRVVP